MDSFADMYTAPERVLGGLHVPSAAAYLVLSAVAYLAYLIFAHRDGSALGCSPRPDLEAVPGGVPLLGNLIDSIRNGERQLEWWQRLRREQHDKSKPLSVTLPVGIRLIDIRNDPACLQHILKDRFQNYIKPKLLQKVVFDFLGSGIFAVNGTEWKVQRQATAKIFTKTQFRTVISSAINSDIVKVVKCFGHYSDSAKSLDLTELLLSFTLSSFGKMAFGLNMDCLVEEGVKRSEFGEAFDICQRISALRIPNPFWRVFEAFSADGRAMKASVKVINHHTYKIIDERQADLKHASSLEDGQARDLLDLYMSARSDSGHALDRKQLRDAVLNLIIAGRDTTAQALSWIYFHLLSQPRYLQLLREDADALFEKDGKIDFDNFRELKFTEAVFNEGLRLHPPVPKSSRQAVAADILPNGTRVDAGDMIRWSNWEIGRDEGVWGPDAKSFRPERWIEEIDGEKHVMNVGQFKGNWFHGGPRLCLGQNLATYEAMLFLATVSRSFDFKFAEGYFKSTEMIDVGEPIPTPRYANAFTLPFKQSFMVDVARRASK